MKFRYDHSGNPRSLTLQFHDDEVEIAIVFLEKIMGLYPVETQKELMQHIAQIEQLRRSFYDS